MIAIDTNVLVRLFINDDEKQAKYAVKLFKSNSILISKTVLLETEWVLRFCYKLDNNTILNCYKNLFGAESVTIEDLANVKLAIELFADGFEFADALHFASSIDAKTFATFDKKLKNRLQQSNLVTHVIP
jgi:predicted nucleic-acid-binding protein